MRSGTAIAYCARCWLLLVGPGAELRLTGRLVARGGRGGGAVKRGIVWDRAATAFGLPGIRCLSNVAVMGDVGEWPVAPGNEAAGGSSQHICLV